MHTMYFTPGQTVTRDATRPGVIIIDHGQRFEVIRWSGARYVECRNVETGDTFHAKLGEYTVEGPGADADETKIATTPARRAAVKVDAAFSTQLQALVARKIRKSNIAA